MDLAKHIVTKTVATYPIGVLHLSRRVHSSLDASHIRSIEDLVEAREAGLSKLPRLGQANIALIESAMSDLFGCANQEGGIDWFKFWRLRNIEVIPSDYQVNASVQKVVSDLHKVIESIFKAESDERGWIIIQRRFGLGGASVLTLEELGIAFGLTRERVRQIEAKALIDLRNVFLKNSYVGKCFHVHPFVTLAIQDLVKFINSIANELILEADLFSQIDHRYKFDPASTKTSLYLVFVLSEIEQIRFNRSDLDIAWGKASTAQIKKIERIVGRINKLFTEEIAYQMSEIDILIEVNNVLKGKSRIGLDDLRGCIQLCSSVESHSDGFYWGKFEHLVSRGHQVERILIERGEPLHISQITREINHRLVMFGKRTVNERNLGNQISGDARFTPIGKSGEWGLNSWALDTGTIVDLMKQSLMTKNSPLTADEIYTYVSERRPVQKSSIDAYLTFREEFAKVDRTTWGLAAWNEVREGTRWTPVDVGKFVEQLFKKHRTKKLQYQLVKQALIEATGMLDRQVRGLLTVNPVINTERDAITNELFAFFQPDYKTKLNQVGAGFKRKKKTLRQEVDEFVKKTLEDTPGQQIALSDLIVQLVNKFNRIDKTFYHYISDLDYIEKFVIPDTNVRMCRLQRKQKAFPFSQVEDIQTSELKTKVGRALTFLTETDVDVALFLLSKEFEATLKGYLETANAKGKIYNLPKGGLSLVNMVDYVGREEIITDKAVLHFLRQQRNDRAHGSMPTPEEKVVMIKYAHTTAGMYIDYIKFFDDLTNAL